MARGGKWCAADETTIHGDRFRANMPTEEVFTSPDPRRTSGTFRCTRPLTLDGRRIDGIHGRFAHGRLVEIGADNDADRSYLGGVHRARPRRGPARRGGAGRRDLADRRHRPHVRHHAAGRERRQPHRVRLWLLIHALSRRRPRQQLADPRRRDDRLARDGGHGLHGAPASPCRSCATAYCSSADPEPARTTPVSSADGRPEGADRGATTRAGTRRTSTRSCRPTPTTSCSRTTRRARPRWRAPARCARTSRGDLRALARHALHLAPAVRDRRRLRQRVDGARRPRPTAAGSSGTASTCSRSATG